MSADPVHVGRSEAKATERRRPYLAAVGATMLGLVVLFVGLVPAALALPAGRGYEKVSPNDKDGQDILNGLDKAALDGNAAAYISFGAFAGSEGGGLVTAFSSSRTPTGWAHRVARHQQVPVPPAWPARCRSTSPMTSGPRSSATPPAIRPSTAPHRAPRTSTAGTPTAASTPSRSASPRRRRAAPTAPT